MTIKEADVPDVRPEKIQKVLSRAGIASRRTLEEWVAAGRVTVNGQVAKLGDRITVLDCVTLDTKKLALQAAPQETRVFMYNKPLGEVCTRRDEAGRKTVFDDHPELHDHRWVMVGRLDYNTSGLLLFTDNGTLAHRLMHPSGELEREYAVRVLGAVSSEALHALQTGIQLDDGLAYFNSIKDAGGQGVNHWYHVVLKEGRNREVRRLWEATGHRVSRLIRLRFGPIRLPRDLMQGVLQPLSDQHIKQLVASVSPERVA